MAVVADRAGVVKRLKARGAKARRGHLRLQIGDLFWYLDPRLDGAGAQQRLSIEVGCWTPELPPEPDGGAVDCPLLFDVVIDDADTDVDRLVDQISGIGDLAGLAAHLPQLTDPLVDRALRDLL